MSQNIDYHGNQGVIVKDFGRLTTDYTGLSSGSAVFSIPREKWAQLPKIYSPHPVFSFLGMSHSEVSMQDGFAIMEAEYRGVSLPQGEFTTPTYELTIGVTEEPIETHPNFTTRLAGTATDPKNGSIWRHLESGIISTTRRKATDGSGYVFAGWELTQGGKVSPYYGIERYLDVGNITWRMKRHGRVGSTAINEAGTIQNPSGPHPTLPGKRNWMNMGTTMTQEGAAATFTTEWRASGPRGWDRNIYD
jgi:hypothetical protein